MTNRLKHGALTTFGAKRSWAPWVTRRHCTRNHLRLMNRILIKLAHLLKLVLIQSHTLGPRGENGFVICFHLRHLLVCVLYSCWNFISNMMAPVTKFSLNISLDSIERFVDHLMHRNARYGVLNLSQMSDSVPVNQSSLQLVRFLLESIVRLLLLPGVKLLHF